MSNSAVLPDSSRDTVPAESDDAAPAPRTVSIWVVKECRYFTDLDGQPASTQTLRADLGYFTEPDDLDRTLTRLNAPLRAAHDQYNAQQNRDHSALWKAYDRAMAERRVILDANLVPSSPEPVRPPENPDEVGFGHYLTRIRSRGAYTMFEGETLAPAGADS